MKHGTRNTYSYHGCRCAECRQAQLVYNTKWRLTNLEHARAYNSEWNKAAYDQARAEALELLGGECVECGTTERLHFDHIDPKTKTARMCDVFGGNRDTWMAEIALCQLLCISCHSKKTNRGRRQMADSPPANWYPLEVT